jgi:hypothetical protein
MSRNGRPNTARAWATIRGGLRGDNRQAFSDAAYELIALDYTLFNAIVSETRLDKPTVRALIEEGADRAWLGIAGLEPASRETRPTSPQRPPRGPESRRNPNTEPRKALPLAPTCEGCGGLLTGRRQGAKYHSDACRMRAARRRDNTVSYLGTVDGGKPDADVELAMREGAKLAKFCSCPRPTPSRTLDRDNSVATSCLKCGHPLRRLDAAA